MVTPTVKREAVAHLKGAHEMSERRACRLLGCERMTVRYRSRRLDDSCIVNQVILRGDHFWTASEKPIQPALTSPSCETTCRILVRGSVPSTTPQGPRGADMA